MLFIDRIKRLDAAAHVGAMPLPAAPPVPAPQRVIAATEIRWSWTIAASALVAVSILLASMRIASWLAELPIDAPSATASAVAGADAQRQRPSEPLPIVRSSEMQIARAGTLFQAGRAAEALRVLDDVDIGDPGRADADRLRAEIQRALLDTEQQ
jgi:hypothetical protein